MKTTKMVASLAAVLLLALGCGDNDTDKDAGGADKGTTQQDLGADGSSVQPDQGAGPNSGELCSGPGTCSNKKDVCLYGPGSSKGMCLMNCSPGTTCPKPSPGPYASECAFRYTSGGNTHYACGWYCEYQGMTYKCPNDTDYTCKALSSSEPNVKFCVAK